LTDRITHTPRSIDRRRAGAAFREQHGQVRRQATRGPDRASQLRGPNQDGSKFLMPEADAADHFTAVLREAGGPKANRTLVIREALLRLADELQGKSSEEIFRYFLERYARRASQSSPSPNGVRSERDR
jgi:hypothetical protein